MPELVEVVDELTRRRFVGSLAAIGALGGCAQATPAAPGASGAQLAHDGGEVVLPQVPSRIVTLGEEVTELAVALGVQPVGVGSARVDLTLGDRAFDGYYLTPAQIGKPRFVGAGPFDLEAITAVRPDLIVHCYQDEQIRRLGEIAPTVLYEFYGATGSWQDSLRRLGAGLERSPQAAAAIAAYEGVVASARSRLTDLLSTARRVAVVYPDFRGRGTNYVYAAEHSVSRPVADIGFTVVGIEAAGVTVHAGAAGEISTELLGSLRTDTILTIGPVDWRQTPAAAVLRTVDVPVVWVPTSPAEPTTGPVTALNRANGFVSALLAPRG